jgi:aryl-alcohol dehydrogenase-like predicted oxidoreductase
LELVEHVKEVAVAKGVTPSQVALSWVLAQGDDVVPIPGTKRRTHLEQNVAADDIWLTDEELRRIDELLPVGAATGDRYGDMTPLHR